MTYENKFELVFASLLNACHLFLPWHSYGKLDTAEVARGIGAHLETVTNPESSNMFYVA